MPLFLERALRYRNYAEELRIIAADAMMPENHQALLRMARDYECMAERLEAARTAKEGQGLPRGVLG